MEPDSLIRGRPFGRCAIFYHKNFSSRISICQVSSRRFCAVRLKISDNETLLLVCVYLPSDTGLSSRVVEYQETLGELEGFLGSQDYDSLAIVGDFSIDFSRSARQRSSNLIQFMDANDLLAKDLDFADIEFTYESDDGTRRSLMYLYLPVYGIEFTKFVCPLTVWHGIRLQMSKFMLINHW